MILLNLHDFIMLENDSKCLIWWRLFSYHFCQENVSNRTKNIFGVKIQIRNYLIFEFSRQKWRKLQNWIIMVFHFDIRNSSKRSSRRSHCYEMRLFYGFSTIVHRHHLSCNAIIFKPWCSWCFLLTILLTLLVVSVAITFFPCQMNQRWKKTWHYGISCKSQIRLFSKSKTNLFMSWGIFNERKRDVIVWQIIPFRFLEALTRLAGKDSDGHFCSRASYYISLL